MLSVKKIFWPANSCTMMLILASPVHLMAQVDVPVVEAGQSQANNTTPANNQNEVMINMYLQLEALQAEIQNLRGTVEEQSYQIRRMQMEQRDRYLDTDSRLTELYNDIQSFHSGSGVPLQQLTGQLPTSVDEGQNSVATGVIPPSARNTGQPQSETPGFASGAAVAATAPQNEQELYRQALNLLLEDEAYQDSINLFQQYLDVYSEGRYLTNALYWQGAALELVGNYNQAIVVLQRLINEYPGDPKAPTAMLRLGTVYHEMGDNAQAAVNWQRISEIYPDATSEIEIANENLRDLSN